MIEHGAVRQCEDLFERSESRSTMRGIEILSDSKRATSSLFGYFFSVGTEKKNYKQHYHPIGNTIFSTSCASLNSGAISSSLNPAMPQPMRVTRNVSSGCSRAKAINSSTYGRIVSTPPCIVGMA